MPLTRATESTADGVSVPGEGPAEESGRRRRGRASGPPVELGEPSRTARTRRTIVHNSGVVRAGVRRLLRTRRRRIAAAVVLLAVLAAAVGGGWWADGRASAADAARADGVATARADVVSLLSYDFRSVEQSLPAAADRLTGPFRDQYVQLARDVVIPAAQKQQTTTSTSISRAGVVSAEPDRVTVLLFLNQTTTTVADPNPRLSGSRVRVVLDRSDDGWRISELTPL